MLCLLSALSAYAAQPAVVPGVKPAAVPGAPPVAKPGEKPIAQPVVPAPPKAAEKEKPEPPPAPEVVWLETKDGWRIHCMYYAPKEDARKGKEVVPIIMLHGWGGQGGEYAYLAVGLQIYGHAVIVPDLRGHGRSVGRRRADGEFQTVKYDDPKSFGTMEMKNTINDVEAVKKWLVAKNNEGEVNIEMLCVVGAEFGAALAVNWAALDWSWPATPSYKQGQDVKALVLLSPSMTKNPKGYQCTQAIGSPAVSANLSVMIAVGENNREAFSDAKRIHGRLETARPKVAVEDRERKLSLYWVPAPTDMQGTKLLDRNLKVNQVIVGFLGRRLIAKQEDFIWSERKSPLGN